MELRETVSDCPDATKIAAGKYSIASLNVDSPVSQPLISTAMSQQLYKQ